MLDIEIIVCYESVTMKHWRWKSHRTFYSKAKSKVTKDVWRNPSRPWLDRSKWSVKRLIFQRFERLKKIGCPSV